jgi:hypothetical protein
MLFKTNVFLANGQKSNLKTSKFMFDIFNSNREHNFLTTFFGVLKILMYYLINVILKDYN